MKKLAMIFLIAALLASCASSPTISSDQMVVQRVIDVPEKTSGEIFDASISWINKSFRSAQAVISYQDRSTGRIVGKGNASVSYNIAPVTTTFTITVETKDGRARLTIDSPIMEITFGSGRSTQLVNTEEAFGRFRVKAEEIISSYSAAVSANPDAPW